MTNERLSAGQRNTGSEKEDHDGNPYACIYRDHKTQMPSHGQEVTLLKTLGQDFSKQRETCLAVSWRQLHLSQKTRARYFAWQKRVAQMRAVGPDHSGLAMSCDALWVFKRRVSNLSLNQVAVEP